MTSARQIASNRINARKSTGPRTLRGKALARRSALRHGLSIPVLSDPALSKEVEVLARKIAGENSRAELLARARAVAEAQVDIERSRRARHNLLSRGLGDADHESTGQEQVPAAVIVASRMRQLARLARYERRALSRRKFATRAFDAARVEEHFEVPR